MNTYCYINKKAFDRAFLIARLMGKQIVIHKSDLELVAIVADASPGEIFGIIQSHDNPWWEACDKTRVQVLKQCRSFAVGDVVKIGNTYSYCDSFRWVEVTLAENQIIGLRQ
jgi:hypothetical protein